MLIRVKRQIGDTVFEVEVEEKKEKDALARAAFYAEPAFCSLCKSKNIFLGSRKAKDDSGDTFTYVFRKCLACTATSTAGEYKDGSGLFWKRWEVYQAGQGKVEEAPLEEPVF